MSSDGHWNWTFKGFVDEGGTNVVQAWYDGATADVRAEFDVLLLGLRHCSHNEWSQRGQSKNLQGNRFRGLTELRFTVRKVRYRPIGMFRPLQTFCLLTVATKQDFNAQCERARKRRALVESDPGGYSYESDCLSHVTRKAER